MLMPRDSAAPPAARSRGAEIAQAASTKPESSGNSPSQRNKALPPNETPATKKFEALRYSGWRTILCSIQSISPESPE